LTQLKQAGIRTVLVSGGFTYFTDRLQQSLGFDYAFANQLEVSNGYLTGKTIGPIIDAAAKKQHLEQIRTHLGLAAEQVIAAGDGANDLPMLAAAGVGIAFCAKPVVRQQAAYALNFSGLDGILPLLGAVSRD
jgi:phosphoserine phosphatase